MFSIKLMLVISTLLVVLVNCDPTMYKKNEQNIYEAGEDFYLLLFAVCKVKKLLFKHKKYIYIHMTNDCVHIKSVILAPTRPSQDLNNIIILYYASFLFYLDLIAFSSTVIPESEMKSEELTAKMDMEYKKAFYGLFKKKFNSKLNEKADTLMTGK